MATPTRVRAEDVRRKLTAGDDTLLVCAYDSDEMFQQVRLEGAISRAEFESRLSTLSPDREIVFY